MCAFYTALALAPLSGCSALGSGAGRDAWGRLLEKYDAAPRIRDAVAAQTMSRQRCRCTLELLTLDYIHPRAYST